MSFGGGIEARAQALFSFFELGSGRPRASLGERSGGRANIFIITTCTTHTDDAA